MIDRLALVLAGALAVVATYRAAAQPPPAATPPPAASQPNVAATQAAPQPGAPQGGAQQPADVSVDPRQWMTQAQQLIDDGAASRGLIQEAQRVAEAMIQANPRDTQALLLGGDALTTSSDAADYERARGYFMRVLDLEPSNFRANFGVGKIWIANRYWRQAAKYLEDAARVAPRERRAEVKQLLSHAYFGMGEIPKAIAQAKEAIDADPENITSLDSLVSLLLRVAERDPRELDAAVAAAQDYVRKAAEQLEADPANRTKLEVLDRAYQLEIAAIRAFHITLYRRDPQGKPTDQLQHGREAEAAAALLKLADKMRLEATLKQMLAEHDARTLVQQAVEYAPDDLGYLHAFAVACERTRDMANAVATYRHILELAPNDAEAQQALERLGAPVEAAASAPAPTASAP